MFGTAGGAHHNRIILASLNLSQKRNGGIQSVGSKPKGDEFFVLGKAPANRAGGFGDERNSGTSETEAWQQTFDDDSQASLNAQFVGVEMDFGVLRGLIGSIDPGQVANLTDARSPV
jgi:hypothetical protein